MSRKKLRRVGNFRNFAAKSCSNLEFGIFSGRNFREKGQESQKSQHFLPAKVSVLEAKLKRAWCYFSLNNPIISNKTFMLPSWRGGEVC